MQPLIIKNIIETEMEDFEKILNDMTKPQVSQLRHQEMLTDAITKAKERSLISWWWIALPLYLLAALLMKSMYMPETTLKSNLHEFKGMNGIASILMFLVLPVIIIIINLFSIRQIHRISKNLGLNILFRTVWFNLLLFLMSVAVILIYLI